MTEYNTNIPVTHSDDNEKPDAIEKEQEYGKEIVTFLHTHPTMTVLLTVMLVISGMYAPESVLKGVEFVVTIVMGLFTVATSGR